MQKSRITSRLDRQSSSAQSQHHRVALKLCLLALTVIVFSGCRSMRPGDGEGLFAAGMFPDAETLRQPFDNLLTNGRTPLEEGRKFSEEGRRQVKIARQQFDDRKYPEAIKSYKKIADKYAGSSIGEEAWFRIGEAHYAMGEYPDAQDAYDKLFVDYPSTKYVSDASKRMFAIAKAWLEVSDPETHEKIKTVSDSKVVEAADPNAKSKAGPSARYRLIPNFFDKSRPLLDTPGRAQNALRSIWLNDPTGPLADDALMLTASYYLQRENYVEADRYLEILRDEYPDSPHLEQAYLLGGHVKQMSYQGPMYDATTLVAAENLKQRSLSLFPNTADRQRLREDLGKIYMAKARDEFEMVRVWQKKDNPRAIAIQCRKVIDEYPDTPYADEARAIVRQIPVSAVRNLPGMADFIRQVQSAPVNPGRPANSEAPSNGPVKSVSEEPKSRNPFRLLGFGR